MGAFFVLFSFTPFFFFPFLNFDFDFFLSFFDCPIISIVSLFFFFSLIFFLVFFHYFPRSKSVNDFIWGGARPDHTLFVR